jgi:hypothetical protein
MNWKDEPTRLANGKTLRTLRDAADRIVSLPSRKTEQLRWQTALPACFPPLKNLNR